MSPLLTDPPADGARAHIGSMNLSELSSDHGSGDGIGGRDGVKVAAVVAVGDPHGLAVLEAGGGGKAHRFGV